MSEAHLQLSLLFLKMHSSSVWISPQFGLPESRQYPFELAIVLPAQ
jgi:hypothetical protein